jgi:hypothetical protein
MCRFKKGKGIPVAGSEGPYGCETSIFWTTGSQMAMRSALRVDRPLPPRRFLVLISVRGRVDPRAIVRLAAQCLNQLRYRVPIHKLVAYYLY